MRTASIATAAALLAALTLTACGGNDDGDGGNAAEETAKSDSTACTADGVDLEVGPSSAAPAVGDEGAVPVTVTNTGAACTLKGIAGVELTAGDSSWKLQPQEGASQETELTLEADQSMTFTISYVRGAADDAEKGAAVTQLDVTLPGDSTAHTFKWPDPEVAIKSADVLEATVGPFLPAGD